MQNKLSQQLQKLFSDVQIQWYANQRLRLMIWGVLYIVLFYLCLVIYDWRQPHNDNLEQLQRKAVRLNQLDHQKDWPERLSQEQQIAQAIAQKLWQASSPSLAEADMQNALRGLLVSHNTQSLRLRLAPTESIEVGGKSMYKVIAEVGGTMSPNDFDHFIKALADNSKLLVVQRMTYNPQGAGQLAMIVEAYFLAVKDDLATDANKERSNVAP